MSSQMLKFEVHPLEAFEEDPNQPRKYSKKSVIEEITNSMVVHGQIVPTISYRLGNKLALVDGHQRLIAAQRAGLKSLVTVVLDERPTDGDLLVMQVIVNNARSDLNPVDRYDSNRRIMENKKLTLTEMAKVTGISKSLASKLDRFRVLPPEILEVVRQGQIGFAKAYKLTQLSKEELDEVARQYFNNSDADIPEPLASTEVNAPTQRHTRVNCQLEEGSVLIRGKDTLSLDAMQSILEKLVRLIRKARKEGLDVTALSHALRCKATKVEQKPC